MTKTNRLLILFLIVLQATATAQNYTFDFTTSGRRVCLVAAAINSTGNTVRIQLLDSLANTTEPLDIYRRLYGTTVWTKVATALPPGTGHWTDNNVAVGERWEYQVKRKNTWNFESVNYDATGYTMGCLQSDNTNYKGQLLLVVANDVPVNLTAKYNRLKKELTADGWLINEVIVPRANSWNSGNEVVTIKNQIKAVYNNAPANDKPKLLFMLGHVPLPRAGATNVTAPDEHDENKGARGCDAYYADMDGVFTDITTYNPGGLHTPLAINLPADSKWDQDFFPSDIEMGFGRVDFAGITELATTEWEMLGGYLDRLSNYRNVAPGFDMGDKAAFYYGYDNSNDGSYRSLPNIALPSKLYQNFTGANHNQWVQNNGPFKVYMQNLLVPEIGDWQTYGMDATVFASDQSYWGFGDVPQPPGLYSRIRALLGVASKCLITLWTTTGINIFHQACSGEPFGLAMKTIMNHNAVNQYLEKPQQQYDTKDWWNRTHFAFYGDPTITLYQVAPPDNLGLSEVSNKAVLSWTSSPGSGITGYHVYKSATEFGKYNRITTTPVTSNSFAIPGYQQGDWYMVKAIKPITSGCGTFLQASIGKDIKGTIQLSNTSIDVNRLTVQLYPNPAGNVLNIRTSNNIGSLTIYSEVGKLLRQENITNTVTKLSIAELANGIYLLKFTSKTDNRSYTTKLIKGE